MASYDYYRLGPVTAYAIAKEHGFVGTEEEWLESLRASVTQVGQYLRDHPEVLQQMNPIRGTVATLNDLPASAALNDTYYVTGEKYRVTWTGTAWVQSSMSEADYEGAFTAFENRITAQVNGISEATQNLWTFGDAEITAASGQKFLLFSPQLPPGTYTFSAVAQSNSATSNCYVGFFKNSPQTAANRIYYTAVQKGSRQSCTFTSDVPIHSICLQAGNNQASSEGYTGTFTDIQIEAGSTATPYTKPFTAVDLVAREREQLDADLLSVLSDAVSEAKGQISAFSGEIAEINEAFEETRNLWPFGDAEITTASGQKSWYFTPMLPPGTYTFSAVAQSNSATSSCYVGFFKDSPHTQANRIYYTTIPKGSRRSVTFTSDVPIESVVLHAGAGSSTSPGYTGSFTDVQIEKGSVPTAYIPHRSAVDHVLRESGVTRHIYVGTDFDNVVDAIISTYGKQDPVTIHIPAGTWPLNKVITMFENGEHLRAGLIIRPNVTLVGAGKNVTVLTLEYTGDNTDVTQTTSGLNLGYDCEISDLTIRVQNVRYAIHDDGGGGYGLSTMGTHATLTNVKAEHLGNIFASDDLYWAPSAYGYGVWGGTSRTFIGCDFIAASYGPWICHNREESNEDGTLVFRSCSFVNGRQSLTSIATSINTGVKFTTWNENQKVHVELTNCSMNRGVGLTSRENDRPNIGPNAFIVKNTGSDPVLFDKPYVHVDEVVYTDADCMVMQVEYGKTVSMYQPVSSTDGYYIHPYVAGEPFWGIALNNADGNNREQVSVRMKGRIHWKYLVSSVTPGKYLDYVDGAWTVSTSGLLKVVGSYMAVME